MTMHSDIKPSPERALDIVRRMLESKRAEQKKMIEEYQTDPRKQAIIEELRRENAKRGTPVVKV